MNKYELMKYIDVEKSSRHPDGFDEDSETIGNAKEIIMYLLRHDESVSNFKLKRKDK